MTGLACGQNGIRKNHMDILWHEYGARDGNVPIREAGLQARASVVGRLGMMMLACGTGACAAAACAWALGLCARGSTIAVHMPGGTLWVRAEPTSAMPAQGTAQTGAPHPASAPNGMRVLARTGRPLAIS